MDIKQSNKKEEKSSVKQFSKQRYQVAVAGGILIATIGIIILGMNLNRTSVNDKSKNEATQVNSQIKEKEKMSVETNGSVSGTVLSTPLKNGKIIIKFTGDKGMVAKKDGAVSMYGVYIDAKENADVLSCEAGKVVDISNNEHGTTVTILHENGVKTLYGNLSKINVKEDSVVKKGDVIAKTGNTSTFSKSIEVLEKTPNALYLEVAKLQGDNFQRVDPITEVNELR